MRIKKESNNNTLFEEEFKDLYDQHFDQLRNYVFYRTGDEVLASDIVQDSFMKLWISRHRVNKDTLLPFLYSITRNLSVSKQRKDKVKLKFQASHDGGQNVYSPEELTIYNETKFRYESALEKLPEKQRVVFLMNRMDGLKYHEISFRLKISVKAVEKRMSKALHYLRVNLKAN